MIHVYQNNYIFSVILGIIFGVIISLFLIGMRTYNHGPNSNKVKLEVFKENTECFRLVPKIHLCPISKTIKKAKVHQ